MKRQSLIEEKLIQALIDLDEVEALLDDSIEHDACGNESEMSFAVAEQTIVKSAILKLSLAHENILARYSKELP